MVIGLMKSFSPMGSYARNEAVYLLEKELFVPYPLQNNLHYLGREIAARAVQEITSNTGFRHTMLTMAAWRETYFGRTLCDLFFGPFHELYTAGLWQRIAPQDPSKSPVDVAQVIRGAFGDSEQAGYNVTFLYPVDGLNTLIRRMAERCTVQYRSKVARIDPKEGVVYFEDNSVQLYSILLSSIPLNRMLKITGIEIDQEPDPYTSVLVLNAGARKGPKCPKEHWLYIPRSRSGFHRVGFYSNVDRRFLPRSVQQYSDRVAIYVEQAYRGGEKPADAERVKQEMLAELTEWGWIGELDVADVTWVDVAYTWSLPGSTWRTQGLNSLAQHGIYQVGRYGSWAPEVTGQGIAVSLKAGLSAGAVVGLLQGQH